MTPGWLPGKTQDTAEGLCLPADLAVPGEPPDEARLESVVIENEICCVSQYQEHKDPTCGLANLPPKNKLGAQ